MQGRSEWQTGDRGVRELLGAIAGWRNPGGDYVAGYGVAIAHNRLNSIKASWHGLENLYSFKPQNPAGKACD